MKDRISEHISYREATRSNIAERYGLDNTPSGKELNAMKFVANRIFEPVRKNFGVPIFVSSFFRSKKVNEKAGGSKTSSHPKGEAIDMDDILGGVTNAMIFYFIYDNLEFDQLIWEFGDDKSPAWVHASWSLNGNRDQVLRAIKYTDWLGRKKTKYVPFKDMRK